MKATVTSFGFSKGDAPDTDHRVDVRFMESPPFPLVRGDGTSEGVSEWVLEHGADFFTAWEDELGAIVAGAKDRDIEEISFGVGCVLGRHRSVATAVRTGEILSDLGVDVTVEHRELDDTTSEEASAMGLARKFPKATRPFYEVRAAAGPAGSPTATDIWIYDVIGDDWYDPSLTAKELCQTIAGIDTAEIVLHLSSPGGSVSDGLAIYNALVSHPAKVTARVEGWTASMATILALAGDDVVMYDNALFMIHNPLMVVAGNAADLREQADWLDRVGGIMRAIYMARCTKTEDELQAALEAETYLSAAEAQEWGFVTDVVVAEQAAAATVGDLRVMQALGLNPDPHYRNREPISADRRARGASTVIDDVLTTLDGKAEDPAVTGLGDAGRTMVSKEMASIQTASKRH